VKRRLQSQTACHCPAREHDARAEVQSRFHGRTERR
jgi:hypothetical protein